jgi:hypothetical protein
MNDKKILGDSGEHYALSMFGFYGMACTKLPDNWKHYDLIVEKDNKLNRVSVKTRSETKSFSKSSWFIFDCSGQYEWVVFIIKFSGIELRSWVLPIEVALKYASVPSIAAQSPNARRLSWERLENPVLAKYLNNWDLKVFDEESFNLSE